MTIKFNLINVRLGDYLCSLSKSVAFYKCCPPGFTKGSMMGVTCQAENAHSSGVQDVMIQYRVHVVHLLVLHFA